PFAAGVPGQAGDGARLASRTRLPHSICRLDPADVFAIPGFLTAGSGYHHAPARDSSRSVHVPGSRRGRYPYGVDRGSSHGEWHWSEPPPEKWRALGRPAVSEGAGVCPPAPSRARRSNRSFLFSLSYFLLSA